MTAGLQIWNAAGQLELDATTRITRITGQVVTGTTDGSFTIPLQSGTPFFQVVGTTGVYLRGTPGVYLVGRLLNWRFSTQGSAPPRQSATILYGYY